MSEGISDPYIVVTSSGPNWRWTYRDDEAEIVLEGNQDFGSREDAVSAASLAYPDLGIVSPLDSAPDRAEGHDRGKLLLKLIGALLAARAGRSPQVGRVAR